MRGAISCHIFLIFQNQSFIDSSITLYVDIVLIFKYLFKLCNNPHMHTQVYAHADKKN